MSDHHLQDACLRGPSVSNNLPLNSIAALYHAKYPPSLCHTWASWLFEIPCDLFESIVLSVKHKQTSLSCIQKRAVNCQSLINILLSIEILQSIQPCLNTRLFRTSFLLSTPFDCRKDDEVYHSLIHSSARLKFRSLSIPQSCANFRNPASFTKP